MRSTAAVSGREPSKVTSPERPHMRTDPASGPEAPRYEEGGRGVSHVLRVPRGTPRSAELSGALGGRLDLRRGRRRVVLDRGTQGGQPAGQEGLDAGERRW